MTFAKLPAAQFGMLVDLSCRVTRRKMIVVKYPDLHAALFALGNNKVHIPPPCFTAKIFVRTRLYTQSAASAPENGIDLLGDLFVVISVLPVKRQHIIIFFSFNDIREIFVHQYTFCL
jgi:hypothetical protein